MPKVWQLQLKVGVTILVLVGAGRPRLDGQTALFH